MRVLRFIHRWFTNQPPASLDAIVSSGRLTDAEARYLWALCRSGRRTPDWLADKMVGRNTQETVPG
jgi:hypothetical protein